MDAAPRPIVRFIWRPIRAVFAAIEWLLGLIVLIALLGVVAAIPIANFVALGVLLDAQGRVARSGRFLDGFPLVPLAPRIGSLVLGVWLWLLPLYFCASVAADARILHPGSELDVAWHQGLGLLKGAIFVHLALAIANGARLSRFFRPLKNLRTLIAELRAGVFWQKADEGLRAMLDTLALKHHFWLGLRGFAGAFAWLFPATLFFAAAERSDGPAVIITLIGAVMLMRVLCWIPFLQGRFAAEGRMGAFTEPGAVNDAAARAPIAFLLAILVTLALSLPLFLFKIVLPPRDALWLITPVFIVGLYPGKLLAGWALARASRRDRPAHWAVRWPARLAAVPIVFAYVFVLYFMQFIGEHGKGVLFEHHAFLMIIGG